MNYNDWYNQHYHNLTGNGLWLRGGELNTLPATEFEKRDFKAMFVRLSTYFDTGYSFTHQLLYQIATRIPGVYPDLAYLPPKRDLSYFRKSQIPWLLGTQSKCGPKDFDFIGFSNSIVQELLNLPSFLINSGISVSKLERMKDSSTPLIILGGANALYSSCIWGSDPLVDGVFVGESDQAIREIIIICRNGKKNNKSKLEVLTELEVIPGFVQPEKTKDKNRIARKSFIPNLNQSEALERGPVYYINDQLGNSHLQISEGCPCFCSFCAESWDRKPYRERGSQQLSEISLRAKAAMGLDRIDIYSFNFNMHSGFYQIIWDLVPHFKNIGLKSQRFDLLAEDPQMAEFQHAIEKASITCGLEGISPRMRQYLHKNLTSDQLHKSISAILKSKARELKVFLIATGLEEEQDFVALEDFIEHLKLIQSQTDAGARIIFSMTPLVRFPWTPLEFENAPTTDTYQKIITKTAAVVRRNGLEFRESADLPEYWVSQVLVRAADDRVSKALLNVIQETGYVYYRDISDSFMATFSKALESQGLNVKHLFLGSTLQESYQKPWAAIETGVKREFLWEEVERARKFTEIDYCLGRSWTSAKCFHCGGCPTRFHVRDIVLSSQKRNYNLEQFKNRIRTARQSEVEVSFMVSVLDKSIGVPRKMLQVALARAMMLSQPKLTPHFRRYGDSLVEKNLSLDSDGVYLLGGEDILSFFFNKDGIKIIDEILEDSDFILNVQKELSGWGGLIRKVDESSKWCVDTIDIQSLCQGLGVDSYLKSKGLKYSLIKTGSNSSGNSIYKTDLIKESRKKGYIQEMSYQKTSEGYDVQVKPGAKLVVGEFFEVILKHSNPNSLVRDSFKVTLKMTNSEGQLLLNNSRVYG